MRHTPCGYFVGLRRGPRWGRLERTSEVSPNRGDVGCADRGVNWGMPQNARGVGTTHDRTHRTTRRSALRGHTLSFREERVWRKTRQRTHGSLETPSLCGYRLRLDESVPDEFALVPSPNSNQRRCSRAASPVLTEGEYRSTPRKLMSGKAFSSTGSPPLRAYRAPEVVRSNTVGSPLGGPYCGGRLQVRWGNPSGKIGDFATSRVVDGSVSLVLP